MRQILTLPIFLTMFLAAGSPTSSAAWTAVSAPVSTTTSTSASSLALSVSAQVQPTPIRIMPLGDSLTAGGYNLHGKWFIGGGYRLALGELLKHHNIAFDFVGTLAHGPTTQIDRDHEGHSGKRIDEVDARIENSLRLHKPNVILLMLGTNDLMQNHGILTAHFRLLRLVRKILGVLPNVKIFVASVLPVHNTTLNAKIRFYNLNLKIYTTAMSLSDPRVQFVDLYRESGITTAAHDFTDTVHPTPQAFARLGQAWFRVLTQEYFIP